MKVTVIPILIGALGTTPKRLVRGQEDLEIGEKDVTIQTTVLVKSFRTLRRVLETWVDMQSSDSCKRPSVNAGVKNSNNNNKLAV